jgi:hypothetical protein
MRSRLAIHIDAPPELVFAVVSDPTRWPDLLPHYRRVEVLRPWRQDPGGRRELVARYLAVRPIARFLGVGLPVVWTSVFVADPVARELHFRHVGGATAGMVVTWQVRDQQGGTRVTLDHLFSRSLPGGGRLRLPGDWYPRLIDRFFVRPIAGRTLATFKALCEALPRGWTVTLPATTAGPGLGALEGERSVEVVHGR